jgi:hypothetical protein
MQRIIKRFRPIRLALESRNVAVSKSCYRLPDEHGLIRAESLTRRKMEPNIDMSRQYQNRLLGLDYDSPFFGLDLRRVEKGKGRIAITHNFSIAVGRPGHLVMLEPNGAVEGYRFNPGQAELTRETPEPALLNEAIAQTQEAHRMFYSGGYHWK